MSTTNKVLRPVGMLEKLYTARQVLGIYHSVIITAVYSVQLTSQNSSLFDIFHATIPGLLTRHPSLCSYFEGENTPTPIFRHLNTIEIKDVLQILDIKAHESLSLKLEELHDQPWSTQQKPLWKLVVINEPYVAGDIKTRQKIHVAFVYHHVLGDGLSGAAFHRSLHQELEKIEKGNASLQQLSNEIRVPDSITLIEPVEELTALPLSWMFLIKQAALEYLPQWFMGAPSPLWAGRPVQTLEECPFRSRVRIVTINTDGTKLLTELSRKHSVTVTSLLTATIVCALAKTLPEATRFLGLTPYTLRRVTGTSLDEMVNQTTTLETNFSGEVLSRVRTVSNRIGNVKELWSTASMFHTQLQTEVAQCPHNNPVGLLPYVVDHVQYYKKKIGRAREATWELSNIGVFKANQHQNSTSEMWNLDSMVFTQGAAPVGPSFSVNCVSVEGGPLNITITWQDTIIHEDVVDALACEFEKLPDLLKREEYIR